MSMVMRPTPQTPRYGKFPLKLTLSLPPSPPHHFPDSTQVPVLPYSRSHRSERPRSIFPGKRFRSTHSESHTPPLQTGFPMSAHLSRLRLFQRHLRSLVRVWAWVWDWVHTSPRTLLPRSPSSCDVTRCVNLVTSQTNTKSYR